MIDKLIDKMKEKMKSTITVFEKELLQIRTGKATPSLLDGISVECYGSKMPLSQIAMITVPEPRQLLIRPYDIGLVGDIVRAINKSDLGLNPVNDGKRIRLEIPVLTEDRKKEIVKLVGKRGEESKVSLRNIRRDANDEIKNGDYPEDEEKKGIEKVQDITDEFIKKVDEIIRRKETEIMNY